VLSPDPPSHDLPTGPPAGSPVARAARELSAASPATTAQGALQPITLALPGPDARAAALLALPAAPGVLAIDDEAGRPFLLLTTADARAAARKRLATDAAPGQADLGAIAARVRCWPVGSLLEGELVLLDLALAEHSALARAMLDRATGWFIHIDPDEPFPRWRRLGTNELALATAEQRASRGTLLGPIRDKHAAARAIEDLNDLFDLCREHSLLVLAPNAQACAYKELGKCPAPCDGSEPLDTYRARLRDAIACWRDPQGWQARTRAEMQRAATALDFERAALLKERLDASAALHRGPLAHAHDDWTHGWLGLARSPLPGCARALRLTATGAHPVTDVPLTLDAPAAWEAIASALRAPSTCLASAASPLHAVAADPAAAWHRLGLIARWLYTPETGRHRPASAPSTDTLGEEEPSGDGDGGAPGKWTFAAIVPAHPAHPAERFTSPAHADTVLAGSASPVTAPGETADHLSVPAQPPHTLSRAWQRAQRVLGATPPPKRQTPPSTHDSRGPSR
jgi:hypothetical protein